MKRPEGASSKAIAFLAPFIALGGSSYAAVKLGDGVVKGRNIAADAVTSPKVKDRSLKAKDFATGQLPAGKDGRNGLPGAPGTPGTALGYALIVKCAPGSCTDTGGYAVESANSYRVDNDHFHHPQPGVFCFNNNLEFNGAAAVKLVSKNVIATVGKSSEPMFAQADSARFGTANVGPYCEFPSDPYGPNNAAVRVYKQSDGSAGDPDTIFVVFN